MCTCLRVTEREIVKAIRRGAGSLDEIARATEAGTGCQSCHEVLLALLEEEARRELARDRAPNALRQMPLFEAGPRRRPKTPRGAHKR